MADIETTSASASSPDPSFSDLRKMLDEGTELQAAPEKPADPEPAPVATPETPAASEEAKPAPESDPVTPEEPAEEEVKLPRGVQKKIQKEVDRTVKARAEAERILEELKARSQDTAPVKEPAAPAPIDESEPNLSMAKYAADYDLYTKDLATYAAKKAFRDYETSKEAEAAERQAAQTEQTVQAAWNERVEAVKEKHSDYESVIADARIPVTQAMREALRDSEIGPELQYHLASHPAECKRIAALAPIAAIRELGKLESKLTAPPTPKPTKAAAALPKPPAVVGTGGTPAEIDLNTCDMRTFRREASKLLAR